MAKKGKTTLTDEPQDLPSDELGAPAEAQAGEVLAHFVLAGPQFMSLPARVAQAHEGRLLDLVVALPDGRSITLERAPRRPDPAVISYPSWEPMPVAAGPSR